jgi:outer membrane protein assembly factor BamB
MAVDAITGDEVWATQYGVDGYFMSTPCFYDGKLFLAFDETYNWSSRFCALDALTGGVLWDFYAEGDATLGTPVAFDGAVYFGDGNGIIYALDADTGSELWRYAMMGVIYMGPSIIEGMVVTGSDSGLVVALDFDGDLIWSHQLSGSMLAAPSGGAGMVFMGDSSGNIYALDAQSGDTVWYTSIYYPVDLCSLAFYEGAVYFTDAYGGVYCYDAFTGSMMWSKGLPSWTESSVAVNNGTLFVPCADGYLYMFDTSNGSLRGRQFVAFANLWSPPAIARGYLYISDSIGQMHAYTFEGANEVASIEVTPPSALLSVGELQLFAARGVDRYGKIVPGLDYVWAIVAGPGSVTSLTAAGEKALFMAGIVSGSSTVRVSAGTVSTDVPVEIVPGAVAQIVITPADASLVVGSTLQFTAAVYDAFGNEIPSVSPVWSATVGSIDQDGLFHAGAVAGQGRVTARVGSIAAEAEIIVTAGSLDHVTVAPASVTVGAGNVVALTAAGYDGYGNEIPGLTFGWSTTIGSVLVLGGSNTALFEAGTIAGSGAVTVTCQALTVEVPVEVVSGGLGSLSISPRELAVVVGGTAQFTVSCYDVYGNEMVGVNLEFSVEGGIGTVSSSGLFTAGIAAGTGKVVVRNGTVSCEADITVMAGALDHISVDPGTVSVEAGGIVSLHASGLDQYENEVHGLDFSWTTTIGTIAVVGGGSEGILQAGTSAGWGNLTVASGSVSSRIPVHVLPGPLASMSISPVTASVSVQGTVQLSVSCYDIYGNSLAGTTVSYHVVGGIGSVSATGLFTAGTAAGSGEVVASSDGISAEASIVVLPGPLDHISVTPVTISAEAGSVVTMEAGAYDRFGNELSLALTWTATIGNVSALGDGSQAVFQAGTAVATGTIAVSGGGLTEPVSVTVVPGPLATLVIEPAAVAVDSGGSVQLSVSGYDAYGNVVRGLTFTWGFSAPYTGGATGTITAASDTATATFAAGGAGEGTITVSAGGKTASVHVTVKNAASTLTKAGPAIAIAALIIAVLALILLYQLVWRRRAPSK